MATPRLTISIPVKGSDYYYGRYPQGNNPPVLVGPALDSTGGSAILTAPAGGTMKALLLLMQGALYGSGQTADVYNSNGTGQMTDLFSGTSPNYSILSTGQMVLFCNWFSKSSTGFGWYGPSLTEVNAHGAAGGIPTLAFQPDNPAGPGNDGGADITDNPNPVDGSGNPTSSSVLYQVAQIIAGSVTSYNAYQTNLINYYSGLCTSLYGQIKYPWIGCLPGEFNGSNNWWNTALPFGESWSTWFTPTQYALFVKFIIWIIAKLNRVINWLPVLEAGTEYYNNTHSDGVIATVAASLMTPDATFPNGYIDGIGCDINSVSTSNNQDLSNTYTAMTATGLLQMGLLSVNYDYTTAGDVYNNVFLKMKALWPNGVGYVYWCQPGLKGGTNTPQVMAACTNRGALPTWTRAGGVLGD